jgi:hypothetical protein
MGTPGRGRIASPRRGIFPPIDLRCWHLRSPFVLFWHTGSSIRGRKLQAGACASLLARLRLSPP